MTRVARARSIGVTIVATFVAGALLGALMVTMFEPMLKNVTLLSGPPESPAARELMIDFMNGDPRAKGYILTHVSQDSPRWVLFEGSGGVGQRTLELKVAAQDDLAMPTPESLTHLGSGTAGDLGTDIYLLQGRDAEGRLVASPYTVYTLSGRVVDVR